MYKIKEVANQFHINANALRFYEKKNLIHPIREENGYRTYSAEDIARIQMILLFRSMGFSIQTITLLLEQNSSPLDMFLNQHQTLNEHLHSMRLIQSSLEDCINLMFQENSYTNDVISHMKTTSELLSQSSHWKNKWNFNQWAVTYDEDIRKPPKGLDFYKNYDTVLSHTIDLIKHHPGTTIEIGVGTGALSGQLLGYMEITGVDQSIAMLKETKRKYPNLPVKIGTFLQLPFEDLSVDNIVTSYAFHHCDEKERPLVFKEMNRVLRPGGQIVIADLMFWDQAAYESFSKSCSQEEYKDLKDEYFSTVTELERLTAPLGYTISYEQMDDLIWIITAKKL